MQIKGIRKIEKNYILKKTKEEQEIDSLKVEQAEIKKNKVNEENQVEKPIGGFQLVVVKKKTWYKKILKAFTSLFKKIKSREIVLK